MWTTTLTHEKKYTHGIQPSPLIWFKMTSQCGFKASDGRDFKLLLSLKTGDEQYFLGPYQSPLIPVHPLLPSFSHLALGLFPLDESQASNAGIQAPLWCHLYCFTFTVSLKSYALSLFFPLSLSFHLTVSLSFLLCSHTHSQTHACTLTWTHTIHFSVIEKMPWLFATLLKWIRWQNIPEVVHLQQSELKRKTSLSLTHTHTISLYLSFFQFPSLVHAHSHSQTQWVRLTVPFLISHLSPFFVPALYYNMNGSVKVELDHLSCVSFFFLTQGLENDSSAI